jgi:hypothetical protein
LPCFLFSSSLYVIVLFSCILHPNPCFISNATVMYHFVVCIWTSPWWRHWEPCWLSENFADLHANWKNIISDNFVFSESNLIFQFDKKHFSFSMRFIIYIKNETVSFGFWTAAEISSPGRDSRQCHCNFFFFFNRHYNP